MPPALLVVGALLLAAGGEGAQRPIPRDAGASAWRGFVDGGRSEVAVGQRMIVVLRNASLAQRVAAAGGTAARREMRRWTAAALAGQKQIAARLSREGVQIVPEFVYTRTFNGFSAALDARALALLERDRGRRRASIRCASPIRRPPRRARSGTARTARARAGAPSCACRASTAPASRSRCSTPASTAPIRTSAAGCSRGSTCSIPTAGRSRAPTRTTPSLVERHATQTAGLLVGRGGPNGLHGAAPGASLLPIRIAGWQPTRPERFAVYGRTDQLLAGLERAVDPDADGSALDAARVAVVGVAEPFAAFSDGPLARAVAGAVRLDTLVVAPVGNEGPPAPATAASAARAEPPRRSRSAPPTAA